MLRTETHFAQSQLANYCRNGSLESIEGASSARLPNYRRLVFGVISEALESSYPLTKNMLSAKEWQNLVHDFFEINTCADPQVWKMPFELIAFVNRHKLDLVKKYPHLPDLLLFEWKEVEYYMMPDGAFPTETTQDLIHSVWQMNPEMEILPLNYPVHLKNAIFISPTDKNQFFCLVFRQPETFKVKFMNLSPFFTWLLEEMMRTKKSPADLFAEAQTFFGFQSQEEVWEKSMPFFEKLKEEGLIL